LAVLTVLSSIGVVLLAGVALLQSQEAMESVARSYVRNLSENVAARFEAEWRGGEYPGGGGFSGGAPRGGMSPMMGFRMGFGPFMPGTVAVFDARGGFLFGTPGSEALSVLARRGIPLDEPIELRDLEGDRYTVSAVRTANQGFIVVAAVSWRSLLGPVVRLATFWPFAVGIIGLFGLATLAGLIRWVLAPLMELREEIGHLKWGEDVPAAPSGGAVDEIEQLRRAFVSLAHAAVDRASLTRRYVDDLVRVQEEERASLSREIHDGPLQAVTALLQRLRLLRRASDPESAAREMAAAESVASACVKELRVVCDGLTPPWLDLGLYQSLSELAERLSVQLSASVWLEGEDPGELPPEVVLALFRVVQEAVGNGVRHGEAREVRVRVERCPDGLMLEVRDDGGGFEPPADFARLRVEGHRGLANMAERMALVGGTLEVRSRPGEGTLVRCVVPLPPEEGESPPDGARGFA
jgi:signal transduction histidine kinase